MDEQGIFDVLNSPLNAPGYRTLMGSYDGRVG